MVFESVCLVDMIVLDMFRTHVGWKEVVRNFFRARFQGNLLGKLFKMTKMTKSKPFLALLSQKA